MAQWDWLDKEPRTSAEFANIADRHQAVAIRLGSSPDPRVAEFAAQHELLTRVNHAMAATFKKTGR